MRLPSVLAEGDDPYSVEALGVMAPGPETQTRHVRVRPQKASPVTEGRALLGSMLQALSWAELRTESYTITRLEEAEGGKLRLALDRPLEWELLAVELDRRGFPQVQVEEATEPGEFLLDGPPEALAGFRRELPAGSELASLPHARVEGSTVEARLEKAFSEHDLRAFFEQQGIPDVYIVPLDAGSRSWRLELSFAPVRAEMQRIFADLAPERQTISFEPAEAGEPPEGKVRVRMVLPESMPFSDVRYQLDSPAAGIYAEEMVEDYDKYGVRSQVSELTLLLPEGRAEEAKQRIRDAFGPAQPVQRIVRIGSTVAEEMQGRAMLAVICASVIIVLYVAMRFHAFRFGVAAVIALVHDVLITAGLLALADWSGLMGDVKIGLATLAAFLTILGYSLNDTIVVFDRIRENLVEGGGSRLDGELISLSINQTLSRTILTSLTTLAVVVVLYVLGGPVLQGLALTLIIGVLVGTYSSMFIASPILLDWQPLGRATGTFFRLLFLPVVLPLKLVARVLGRGK
jgi:preprotein translocase SecF subunit